ncbi:MAG TPA: hypothetical protein VK421_16930, partial [Pyrinomonadaceae bacterium]|nr:hypothetical protein [Pyrinomonadaceae bacterium]
MSEAVKVARERFRSLAQVEFDPRELLPAGEDVRCAAALVEAADVADEIFWRQALPPGQSRAELFALADGDDELRELLLFNYGPYDRLDNNRPFLPAGPKPPGANFYPPDLTDAEFARFVSEHP